MDRKHLYDMAKKHGLRGPEHDEESLRAGKDGGKGRTGVDECSPLHEFTEDYGAKRSEYGTENRNGNAEHKGPSC